MKTIYLLLFFFFSPPKSIYDFVVKNEDGTQLAFSDFKGKKILIVNIASNSERAGQLAELQTLQDKYERTLVVIGFPSNSFGKENRSRTNLQNWSREQYGVKFRIVPAASVKGSAIQPVYRWLTSSLENGNADQEVNGDFQKFLIDEGGELVGVFSGAVSPLNPQIVNNLNATGR